MNKLRGLSWGGGAGVVVFALWGVIHYGTPVRFLPAIATGIVAAGLPYGLARLNRAITRLRRRLADPETGISAEKGSVFVSKSSIDDPVETLETVRDAVKRDEEYDETEREAFEEGPGLSIRHGGFHNTFVRITRGGRVVVTGASERTADVRDVVGDACSLTFDRTRENPFQGLQPIKGAPRVFLGVFIFTLLVAGTAAVGAGAYPTDAYNPAERVVLVGIDVQGDVDPSVSETDTQLSKASFLADVVAEGETEVRWAQNDSELVAQQGRNALRASNDARRYLASARAGSPTSEQLERADRIERRLRAAEQSVAEALSERATDGSIPEENATKLSRLGDRFESVERPSGDDGDATTTERVTRLAPHARAVAF
ncbi:hypothetical protein ACFQAS_03550 [Halopenitus salinus]|uniref:Uncharacterized protein n=1 Tax=Halopenitus salinus TaxID=1198295 RepID=A0ABD5URD2_9EURY